MGGRGKERVCRLKACCAEYKLVVDFDRDYWILVTPGTELLVPLPTLSILNLCV